MRLYMMRGGSLYTTDQLLNRRPFNYIVQPLSSPQRGVLFGDNLKGISRLGFRGNQKYKQIGVLLYRRSKATRTRSPQWPSPPTASRSCLDLMITQCGSGTLLREHRSRRSRATRTWSPQWPSPLTESRSCLDLMITQCGSGTLLQEHRSRRSRATRARSPQWPSPPMASYYQLYTYLIIG